jgi:hypothetical protein
MGREYRKHFGLSDLGNILAYYRDKTTLLYEYYMDSSEGLA